MSTIVRTSPYFAVYSQSLSLHDMLICEPSWNPLISIDPSTVIPKSFYESWFDPVGSVLPLLPGNHYDTYNYATVYTDWIHHFPCTSLWTYLMLMSLWWCPNYKLGKHTLFLFLGTTDHEGWDARMTRLFQFGLNFVTAAMYWSIYRAKMDVRRSQIGPWSDILVCIQQNRRFLQN